MRILLLLAVAAASLHAEESIGAFGHKWNVLVASDWKLEDGVLQLTVPRPQEKNPRRPKQFALLMGEPYRSFTLKVDVKRNGAEKSVIIVYAHQDDNHFDYVHLSVDDPKKQPVHNGVFHVYGGDRVRISSLEGGPGPLVDNEWHHVKMSWSGSDGAVHVAVDGKTMPSLRGIDLSLNQGRVGLGSFFETAQFRNFKIQGN